MARFRFLLSIALLLGLLAACAEDVDDAAAEPSPEPTSTDVPPPEEPAAADEPDDEPAAAEVEPAALAYFEALATKDPDAMVAMTEHAADGSSANAYGIYQTAQYRINRQEGFSTEEDRLSVSDGAIELCDSERCTEFADFELDDGLLTKFTVNGESIDGRLLLGDGSIDAVEGAQFEFVVAYRGITWEGLVVAVEVRSGDEPLRIYPHSSTYVGPDGRQVSPTDAYGPMDLRANASATYLLLYEGAHFGGTMYLEGTPDEDFGRDFEVAIPLSD